MSSLLLVNSAKPSPCVLFLQPVIGVCNATIRLLSLAPLKIECLGSLRELCSKNIFFGCDYRL